MLKKKKKKVSRARTVILMNRVSNSCLFLDLLELVGTSCLGHAGGGVTQSNSHLRSMV